MRTLPDSVRERFLQTVSSLIIEIADFEPILLFIDDLQWADPSSLALIHLLSRGIKESKAVIIGAYRAEQLAESSALAETLRQMKREDLTFRIELKSLEKKAYSEILRKRFQSDFGPEFLDRLYEETEGSPLFALETLRLLLEEGIIQHKEAGWTLTQPLFKVKIPERVRDVLEQRLAKLSKEDMRILELASVIGDEFESAPLQQLLSLNKLELLQVLSSMEHTHSLIQSLERTYRITHSIVREAIYDQLTPELRREHHRMIGEWIEKEYTTPKRLDEFAPILADHFFSAEKWDKALTYSAMTGDRAMQIHAHQEALQSYARSLQAATKGCKPLPSEITSSLQERYALAAMASGRIEEALNSFESLAEGARRTGDQRLLGEAKLLHGWASFWNKDLETAIQDCSDALALGKSLGNKTLEGRSLYLTGTSLLAKGLREEAKIRLDDSLRISRETGDKITETQTLLVLLMEGLSS